MSALKRVTPSPAAVSSKGAKRRDMHYFQFHIGDYKSHTHHLSLIEDLAYRRLLDHYYLHEVPIRQREVARQIGMREHEQEVLTVLNEFFVSTENGFINPRADDEILKYKEFSSAGKRGAAKRWSKGGDSPPISPPNATPIATITHKPLPINQIQAPDGVSSEVWDSFVKQRKTKKAQITDLVIQGIIKEADKAGWTLENALIEIISRNWVSFKADWVTAKPQMANKWDVANVTTPPPPNQDAALRKIEQDNKRAVPIPDNIREAMAKLKAGV